MSRDISIDNYVPPAAAPYVPVEAPNAGVFPTYQGPPTGDSQAMVALLLGLASIFCLPVLGPVAFLVGRSSRRRIKASAGRLKGGGKALIGQVLGAIGTIFLAAWVLALILSFVAGSGQAV